ncbi:MAG: MATE family efflux transporter [Geminicoccaceae bacterium]|nr:MATE family efflux transporter [Geminicoccaceae bacterium]MDW8124884.1 MATE family efflux transporter [Geminicoccaceae bacterium]
MTTRRTIGAAELARGPIIEHIRRIAVPSATAMALQTLFNITNSFWAGTWSTEALAALAVSFPVFFVVVIAASFGFSQGGAALLAHALGKGDIETAVRLWAHALSLAALGGAGIAVASNALAPSVVELLGATARVRELALEYLRPLLATTPLFLLTAAVNAALTATGDTKSLRNAMFVATVANVVLVPSFMYGLGPLPSLGVAGIASAHLLVQLGQLVWLARRAGRTAPGRGLVRALGMPDVLLARRVLAQVVPNTLTLAATGAGLAIVTGFAGRHGAAAVAAYGVALRIEQLVLLPTLGLNAAIVALVGQNLGAGETARVRAAVVTSLSVGVGLMSLGGIVVFVFRSPLLALFTDDPEVVSLGALYLAIAVSGFPAYGVVVLAAGALQGLRKPLLALWVGIGRHLLVPPLFLWLFDHGLGLGFRGVALAVVLTSWIAAVTSGLLVSANLPRAVAQAAAR